MGTAADMTRNGRDLELTVSRVIAARREVVWSLWTDARHVERWWRPEEFGPCTCERMDVRPGGGFRIIMPRENGETCVAWGTFTDVVPNERLAYEDRCDFNGKTVHAATLNVTFEECPGGIRITITTRIDLAGYTGTGMSPAIIEDGWTRGWNTNIDNLAAVIAEQSRGDS